MGKQKLTAEKKAKNLSPASALAYLLDFKMSV